MSILQSQYSLAAIYLATLGKKADSATLDYFGRKLNSNATNPTSLANAFINSPDGHNRYDGLSNSEKISYIYKNITGMEPDSSTLSTLTSELSNGRTLGSITMSIINTTESYNGTDPIALQQRDHLEASVDTTLYPSFDKNVEYSTYASDIQAVYYSIGGTMVSSGINFWANELINAPEKLNKIAQNFITSRPKIDSLSNDDFVKFIFENVFNKTPSSQEMENYLSGLENGQETRGDIVVRMINDIRSDDSGSQANIKFNQATKVYLAGELPELKYQEIVASFYLAIAKSTVPASALDTYSKYLASGNTEADLLKILSNSDQFKLADNYGAVYQYLYGVNLTQAESQAILLKAGNDNYQATNLIIAAFRAGNYPLDNHSTPLDKNLVIDFEREINTSLNYTSGPATLEISANGGNPSGIINTGELHQLTNAELTKITEITLNANVEKSVDLSFSKATKITVTGEYAASNLVLGSLNSYGKNITLLLDNQGINNIDSAVNLGHGNIDVVIKPDTDVTHANAQLLFYPGTDKSSKQGLYWEGNGENGGANQISTLFTAKTNGSTSTTTTLSANFITKDIFLTSQQDGSVNAEINSSYDQFFGFQYIDLTNYKGTGSIYLDGALVSTEGKNVFDFGVTNKNASIYNTQYADVEHLTQAPVSDGNYTGNLGLTISAYSGEINVINLSPGQYSYTPYSLIFNGDVTSESKVHLNYLQNNSTTTGLQGFGIRLAAPELKAMNAGTVDISAKGNYIGALVIVAEGNGSEKTLTLTGADNHIQRIELDGMSSNILNLTIAHNFSDSLKTISAILYVDHRASDTILNLNAEKGGTGGGSFYNTLLSLDNSSSFTAITTQLAGEQLSVGNVQDPGGFSNANIHINNASVQGNTTLEEAVNLRFSDSHVDSLVSLLTLSSKTQIHIGDNEQQWSFSSSGDKVMQVYGSVTKPSELNALFDSIDMSNVNTANDLFSELLASISDGASQGALAEVGAIKLDHTVYVIIDKNHNQSFDNQDIVFALGNQNAELDVYQTAVSLHYQSPNISLIGQDAISHEAVA
ncbi:DUF4214 domain-containing protein [Serratia sp. AKBS12]|uniref:DUF4214 domain-containing protein n=1 Tax=Serratia sp. AKBS12 TaxID=2974597 RepID=UPI002165C267|nr:DUF4214 domain-containing protein [Serratia sp. AKBS12]MCS3408840.1 DUF4214 domain-containing protein [Serratia sp. AKBS12]